MITAKGKIKGYAFVMMSNGMPRIDNPLDVPKQAWDTLTLKQRIFANDQVKPELRRPLN